jgi:tryptophan 2,3-dioxygenase
MASTPNYWDYLGLQQLLSLQGGLEQDEKQLIFDELHFIVTHQVLELWFKLALAELRHARDHLAAPKVPDEQISYVVHHLRRVNSVFRLLVSTFEVMETLTPQDFLSFRDKLTPASGFQSFQMREIEILMGMTAAKRVRYGKTDPITHIRGLAEKSPTGEMAWGRLVNASTEQTLRQSLHHWLYRTPINGSHPDDPQDAETVRGFLDGYLAAVEANHARQAKALVASGVADEAAAHKRFSHNTDAARAFLMADGIEDPDEKKRVQRIRAGLLFIESYRDLPLLAFPRLLIDTVVEFEEQIVLFRTRHARMVERVIGRRVGTGGSSGVDYLDQTTRIRIFTDLWSVRTILLPRKLLPEVSNSDFYGFQSR